MPFTENTLSSIDAMMQKAWDAFGQYQKVQPAVRATLLENIAEEIANLGDDLISTASRETNLPTARITGERGRTINQVLQFAALVREGSWVDAVIDTADAGRIPPKPDLRKMNFPLGPVVVFGASNFPLAFSTAGGDTASALAAGCSVVIKGHPGHPATSEMVYQAIVKAVEKTGLPADLVQHVSGTSFEIGKWLVQHPHTRAVGFTGSQSGGTALMEYARTREKPIPVFAEMGSINPVIFMPDALANQSETLAQQYAGSITLGVGQFCTNPGLLLAVEGPSLDDFLKQLWAAIEKIQPAKMLHEGIHKSYLEKLGNALGQVGINVVGRTVDLLGELEPPATVASVSSVEFLRNPLLHEEIFGPYSLMVRCSDIADLHKVLKTLAGQLTVSMMATPDDLQAHPEIVDAAREVAGRILFNGVPTGVEVSPAMMHGGPYPATSDSRFTSVGTDAIRRWVRPVCYQNCPEALLPDPLKNNNPDKLWRRVNGQFTQSPVE